MKKEQDFNQTDELLVKYLTGMADQAERELALNWIRKSGGNRQYFKELLEVYEAAKLAQPETNYDVQASFERVKARHYKNLALQMQHGDRENARLFWLEFMKYAVAQIDNIGV